MTTRGYRSQSSPITTPSPMQQLAPMWERSPTTAWASITAWASMAALGATFAEAWTTAVGWTPAAWILGGWSSAPARANASRGWVAINKDLRAADDAANSPAMTALAGE